MATTTTTSSTSLCWPLEKPPVNAFYRTALVLNNQAVTWMQHGQFGPAMRTMCECLSNMQRAFVTTSSTTHKKQKKTTRRTALHPQEQYPQSKHKSKNHQNKNHKNKTTVVEGLPEAHPSSSSHTHVAGRTKSKDHPDKTNKNSHETIAPAASVIMDIEPIEDTDIGRLLAMARYGPTTSMASPIRIAGAASCDETDEIQKHFGIMLYNHGLATFLVSTTIRPKQRRARTHRDGTTSTTSSTYQRYADRHKKYMARSQKSLEMAEKTLVLLLAASNASHSKPWTDSVVLDQQQQQQENRGSIEDMPSPGVPDLSVFLLLALSLNSRCVLWCQAAHDKPHYWQTKVPLVQQAVTCLCGRVMAEQAHWSRCMGARKEGVVAQAA